MVYNGPEPPEESLEEVIPPLDSQLPTAMESDDDDEGDYSGYQPLAQGPDGYISTDRDEGHEEEDIDSGNETGQPSSRANIPPIEPVDVEITRQIWSTTPRSRDSIQMDSERVQQVMSAMANFALPMSSIPEWAQSVSEDQWKQQLQDKIESLRSKQ